MSRVLVQSVCALAVVGGVCTGARAASSVVGNTYAMNVSTSFNTHFSDCWTFDNQGNLTINDLGTELYQVNFQKSPYFSAVPSNDLIINYGGAIGFAGIPNGKRISVIGSDYSGNNYYGTGKEVASCTLSRDRPAAGTNPYRR